MKPLDGEPIESWTRQRSHGGPIDYERRRRLDYSTLLTEGSWPKAAADAHSLLAGTTAVPARCYLIGRISESPTVALLTHPEFDPRSLKKLVTSFGAGLTPPVEAELDDLVRGFLRSRESSSRLTATHLGNCSVARIPLDGREIRVCGANAAHLS